MAGSDEMSPEGAWSVKSASMVSGLYYNQATIVITLSLSIRLLKLYLHEAIKCSSFL